MACDSSSGGGGRLSSSGRLSPRCEQASGVAGHAGVLVRMLWLAQQCGM